MTFAIIVYLGAIGWVVLHQLFSRYEPKVKRVLGFRIGRELDFCGGEIMAVLEVANFHHDRENVWEWVESAKGEQMDVNISRPHANWNVPVVVYISGPAARLTDELFFGYAQQIADRLRTEVWIGQPIDHPKDDSRYDFDIETRFKPVRRG